MRTIFKRAAFKRAACKTPRTQVGRCQLCVSQYTKARYTKRVSYKAQPQVRADAEDAEQDRHCSSSAICMIPCSGIINNLSSTQKQKEQPMDTGARATVLSLHYLHALLACSAAVKQRRRSCEVCTCLSALKSVRNRGPMGKRSWVRSSYECTGGMQRM